MEERSDTIRSESMLFALYNYTCIFSTLHKIWGERYRLFSEILRPRGRMRRKRRKI